MKRLAVLLLAGATLVAAQMTKNEAQVTDPEVEKIRTQIQERLKLALDNAGEKVELAKEYALRYQKELEGKTPEERAQIMEQRKKEAQERLQKAIEALDKASENVGAQIEEVKERIQKRLQEKKDELIKLQERIRTREEARKHTGDGSGYGEGGVPPVEQPEQPDFGGGSKAGEGSN